MDPDLTRSCDWEAKGVAIYDMSSLTWGSVFDYYGPGYTVLAQVVANIGGTYVLPSIWSFRDKSLC